MILKEYSVKFLTTAIHKDFKKGEKGVIIGFSDNSAIVVIDISGRVVFVNLHDLEVGQKCKTCGKWNVGVGGKYCNTDCALAPIKEVMED